MATTTMDNIVRVDTTALLTTIREIESALSEHHRQDKLPSWATKFVNRLDRLEEVNDETYKKVHLSGNKPVAAEDVQAVSRPMGPGVSMTDLANDERILLKFKTELDLQVSNVKVSLESKVSSAALELDRLHKLLQIRPTTSELQQVVVNIFDLNRKMQEGMKDVTSNVKAIVQDKVAEHMTTIMEQLKATEQLSEQNYKLIMNKVDGFTSDVSTIRQDVETKFSTSDKILRRIDEEIKAADKGIFDLRMRIENDYKTTQDIIDNVKFTQQMSQEVVADYRASISNQLIKMNNSVASSENTIKDMLRSIDERDGAVKEILVQTKDSFSDFRAVYELDMGTIRNEFATQSSAINSSLVKQDEIESFVSLLKAKNVLNTVVSQEESLNKFTAQLHEIDDKVKAIQGRTQKISKIVGSLDDLIKNIPANITAQEQRVDSVINDNNVIFSSINELKQSIGDAQRKLDAISSLRDEISDAKKKTAAVDSRIKQVQVGFNQLNEVSIDHNKRIEIVVASIIGAEEQAAKRLDEVRLVITDMIVEKQAEIDASVQNMREKLDMIAQSGDGGNSSTGGGSSSTTRKGFGNMVGNAGKKSGAGGDASNGGAPGESSQQLSGGALSEEEQKAITLNQAQFIADLCTNFEEIAVRKSQVLDIPPTMCEHITATSQSLAAFIATCTDADMVQKIIKSAPEEVEYEEEVVSDLRQAKLMEFIVDVNKVLRDNDSANGQNPGAIRTEARDRFLKQVKKALSLCMSKHDQVLIAGNTKLGRLKIPSCIACDRPLLEKVRQDSLYNDLQDDSMTKSFVQYFGHNNSVIPESSSPMKKSMKAKERIHIINTNTSSIPTAITQASGQQLKLLVPRADSFLVGDIDAARGGSL